MIVSNVMGRIAEWIAVAYGVYGVLKFGYFALPYKVRRRVLDQSYASKVSATSAGDVVLLMFMVVFSILLFARGVEAVSFLGGLMIGATLIQLFFHRFHRPLLQDRMPSEPISPIKMLSYAIQDSPVSAWKEMTLFAVLVVCAIALMMMRHGR